ncbi:MAG TPA: tryptophan--tRNA ligase, partial [Chitinophagales bacterium]
GFNYGGEPVIIPSLDGVGKMSKSNGENTCIYLGEDAESIRKKIMKATTSATPTEPNSPKTEAVQNIFDLMKLVSSNETMYHFEEAYNNCNIRFGDMKKQIAEDMITFLAPIRENILKYSSDKKLLNKVLEAGNEKARESAAKTIREVREIIGLK